LRPARRCSCASSKRSVAIIFGTQTTIDAGAYPRLLAASGIAPARIISQACPGLADTISEDREGTRTLAEIRGWEAAAMAKLPDANAPVIAYLACTHYGYRRDFFSAAKVIDPNERAVDDLFAAPGPSHDVEVEFVTRYAIPPATIETLTFYLSDISPRTVAAMQNFVHVPGLF
jgi:glutamate racemase